MLPATIGSMPGVWLPVSTAAPLTVESTTATLPVVPVIATHPVDRGVVEVDRGGRRRGRPHR